MYFQVQHVFSLIIYCILSQQRWDQRLAHKWAGLQLVQSECILSNFPQYCEDLFCHTVVLFSIYVTG